MARRAGSSRSRDMAQKGVPPSPYICRTIPHFDILDEGQILRLEGQVDWILQDVGIAFRDDSTALELWRREGATIEDDIVRAPADWIAHCAQRRPANSSSWLVTGNGRLLLAVTTRFSHRFMEHPLCATWKAGGAMAI